MTQPKLSIRMHEIAKWLLLSNRRLTIRPLLVKLPCDSDQQRHSRGRGKRHDEVRLKPIIFFTLIEHHLEWAEGQNQQHQQVS